MQWGRVFEVSASVRGGTTVVCRGAVCRLLPAFISGCDFLSSPTWPITVPRLLDRGRANFLSAEIWHRYLYLDLTFPQSEGRYVASLPSVYL